jgi:hypothetical protein
MLLLPVEVGHCYSTILCADIGDVRADWSIGQIEVGVNVWELREELFIKTTTSKKSLNGRIEHPE